MDHSKEKNKKRLVWKKKRKELFFSSSSKDQESFLSFFSSIAGVLEGKIVAGYNSFGGEVNCLELLKFSSLKGALTALPYVNSKKFIEFREWKDGDDLEPDFYNIPSPKKNNILIPDIILIPLLCFDLNGMRLGMGGGIYDRSLPFFNLSDKFGLAFSGQEVKYIHKEEHDFLIDGVITEKKVFIFKGKTS